MEKIKNIFGSSLFRWSIILVTLIIMGLSVNHCRSSVERLVQMDKQVEHNIKVGKDTVRIVVNNAGFTEYDKLAYIGQIKDLQLLNDSLYKNLKDTKGNVTNLTNAVIRYKNDSIKLTNTIEDLGSGHYGLKFVYAKRDAGSFQNIEGISKFKIDHNNGVISPDTTILTKNILELNVILGHRKTDTGYEFFATSKSPNFVLKDAQSFVEVPKPEQQKRFGLGVHVGYGVSVYGNDVKVGPNVSVGLNYNFLKF